MHVKRWIDRWNAYWFPTTTTLSLAISRILAVAAQLFWFFPNLDKNLNLLKNTEFTDPQPLIRAISAIVPRAVFFTPTILTAVYWITVVAGITALVGLFTRTSLLVFALGIWFFVSHTYSYADIHHPEALFCIFLLALAFAPSGKSLSLDALFRRRRAGLASNSAKESKESEKVDTAMWPLKLAHVLLAMTYLSTGMSKLIGGGPAWMNGYTLQLYTFADAMNRGKPLGIWLAQQHTLAIGLSVLTVLLETLFFLSLILPWAAPFFFFGALLFQIGLFLTAGHNFFQHMVLLVLLLLFINPDWWRSWWNKYVNRSSASPISARPTSAPSEPQEA
jgi:Vitamin K-dependent gamma-carboxylase